MPPLQTRKQPPRLDILGGRLQEVHCILISSFIRRYKEVLAIGLCPGALQYRDRKFCLLQLHWSNLPHLTTLLQVVHKASMLLKNGVQFFLLSRQLIHGFIFFVDCRKVVCSFISLTDDEPTTFATVTFLYCVAGVCWSCFSSSFKGVVWNHGF